MGDGAKEAKQQESRKGKIGCPALSSEQTKIPCSMKLRLESPICTRKQLHNFTLQRTFVKGKFIPLLNSNKLKLGT